MLLAEDFRRHAHVCARLADDCDDPRLAERFKARASDLLAKADDFEESPGKSPSLLCTKWAVAGREGRATKKLLTEATAPVVSATPAINPKG
jgi:hypothetical protein